MTTTAATTATPPVDPLLERVRAGREFGPNVHSTLDVLQVLYDRILRITPTTVDDPDRDRFLLSKGHAVAGYWAVLAARGFIPADWLDDQGGPASRLGDHPDRLLVPGVEIGSGSLGHGLGLGVGTALGLRAQGLTDPRVYVLLGDAELDEGSNHEAIAYAGATGLASLTAIVVDNSSATHGWPGGIATRFTVNGWTAATVDGRDHDALHTALTGQDEHRPHVVVAVVESGE
ncbi:transketolase [Micromonospora endolithica]|uniref:Transketolase n=1 Tax=Micromonospora endolithica TaxID=230091 RepID=A0A3A9ZFY2_9ACTN|nr:transketolase [Micromonospora endolithica]RKN46206.1 transketolase [Micromonospora endolithica]TWJ25077.1 transketolase [Micromonospora endolithica]